MELNISFAGGKPETIKLRNFKANLNGNMVKGLKDIGALLKRALQLKVKPSNPTTFFAPGVPGELRSRTGELRRSINFQLGNVAQGPFVKVGPYVPYAAIHEFGGRISVTPKMRAFLHRRGVHLKESTTEIKMPRREWFMPTYKKEKPNILKKIEIIYKPIRRG